MQDNVLKMRTPARTLAPAGIIREFKLPERFEVGVSYDIFKCDDATGSFIQLAGPFMERSIAENALGAFQKHPDFANTGTKIFIAECKRMGVMGNFNPRLITPRDM